MPDLTQSSQTTETTTPGYYTDYISNLAKQGTAAGNAAVTNATGPNSAYDPNALQNSAFTNVAANVGNYQPGLAQAGTTLGQAGATDITGAANPYLTAGTTTSGLSAANPYLTAGTSSAADLVGSYMNPYTQNVVDQIRNANQQNIAQNLSPGITAGAVGAGQFGSQRGANALALGISNANIGALSQQAAALQSGYSDALKAAEQQRANQMTAGSTAGTLQNQFNTNNVTAGNVAGTLAGTQAQNLRDVGAAQGTLAQQTQNQGLADTNALATLGGQQQTIAQNKLLAPLDILGKQAGVLSGANLPTTVKTTMDPSVLGTIAGMTTTGAGIFAKPVTGKDASGNPIYGTSLFDTIKGQFSNSGAGGGSPQETSNNPFQSADGTWYPTQAAAAAADKTYLSGATGSSGAGGSGSYEAADGNTYATQAEADAATQKYLAENP